MTPLSPDDLARWIMGDLLFTVQLLRRENDALKAQLVALVPPPPAP